MLLLRAALIAMAASQAAAQDDEAHVSEAGDVRVLHAWTNATEATNAQVYMEIENEGQDIVTLTGAEAPISDLVTLVGSSIRAGDPTVPETIDAIPILGGRSVELEPGGLFLMLADITRPLMEGESFPIDVMLDPIGPVEVTVEVLDQDATEHPHAGHPH